MKLIKVKGIVIREVAYKDNDKIITILTDTLGKVSAIAKGAKKTNSQFLASSQYLVYSEFVLYQNTGYFYLNSASVINTFYNLRVDLDKLQVVFEDCDKILQLFLNTIYVLDKYDKDKKMITNVFKIKLFAILGFAPGQDKCSICQKKLLDEQNKLIYYDFVSNVFICADCKKDVDERRLVKLSFPTYSAILYIIRSQIKKIFSFELKKYTELEIFGQVFTDSIMSGL